MAALIATLPVQLACQLICKGNYSANNFSLAIDTQMPKQTTELPNGYTAFPDVGVAYKYFHHDRTWDSARKHCIEEGGNLAIIDSFKKIEYIMGIKVAGINYPWVGFHRLFNQTEWTSVKTGLPQAVIPWATDSIASDSNLCAYMGYDGRGIVANPCTSSLSFVCEIPLPMD